MSQHKKKDAAKPGGPQVGDPVHQTDSGYAAGSEGKIFTSEEGLPMKIEPAEKIFPDILSTTTIEGSVEGEAVSKGVNYSALENSPAYAAGYSAAIAGADATNPHAATDNEADWQEGFRVGTERMAATFGEGVGAARDAKLGEWVVCPSDEFASKEFMEWLEGFKHAGGTSVKRAAFQR